MSKAVWSACNLSPKLLCQNFNIQRPIIKKMMSPESFPMCLMNPLLMELNDILTIVLALYSLQRQWLYYTCKEVVLDQKLALYLLLSVSGSMRNKCLLWAIPLMVCFLIIMTRLRHPSYVYIKGFCSLRV